MISNDRAWIQKLLEHEEERLFTNFCERLKRKTALVQKINYKICEKFNIYELQIEFLE